MKRASGAGLPTARHRRLVGIDAARGVAIVMMVIYHLVFDLSSFGGLSVNPTEGFWHVFQRTIAGSFVFLVGVSLVLSHHRVSTSGRPTLALYPRYLARGARIFALGLVITAVTWVIDSEQVITFGILHLIGVVIVLAYPLIGRVWLNIVLGAGIIIANLWVSSVTLSFPWLLWLGLRPAGYSTFDHQPLVPWLGVALLGLAAGQLLHEHGARLAGRGSRMAEYSPVLRGLASMGRRSLPIYLVHQPVLITGLWALGIVSADSL